MNNEKEIEAQIVAAGSTAPRVTLERINEQIIDHEFHIFPGTTVTVCALTLRNGFIVTGVSAAASAENFNEAIGQKIAYDNARNKIWELEGYLLKQKLFEQSSNTPSYQDRVKDEREKLDGNVCKLAAFINLSPVFQSLQEAEQEAQREQLEAMYAYRKSLDKRIALFVDPASEVVCIQCRI